MITRIVTMPLLAIAVAALWACKSASDEDRIRAAIGAMAKAVEQGSARDFVGYVHDEFQDHEGRDRTELRGLVNAWRIRYQKVNTFYRIDEITLSVDSAQAGITIHVSGGAGVLPQHAGRIDVRTDWRKAGGKWLLYRANWERNPVVGDLVSRRAG